MSLCSRRSSNSFIQGKVAMKCISCGKAKMIRETRDLQYTYKGHSKTIKSVTGEFCPSCGESIHDEEEASRISAIMLSFNKEVNKSILDTDFIGRTRKKLKLGQKEAAEIFGGGANAFSRYENGKVQPPLSLIQLFKILDNHPELLDEIRPQPSKNKEKRPNRKIKFGKLTSAS